MEEFRPSKRGIRSLNGEKWWITELVDKITPNSAKNLRIVIVEYFKCNKISFQETFILRLWTDFATRKGLEAIEFGQKCRKFGIFFKTLIFQI